MDIVQRVKITRAKCEATYQSIGKLYKIGIVMILVSLISIIIPHEAYAAEAENEIASVEIVFEAGDHTQFLDEIISDASFQLRHEATVQKLKKQLRMNEALEMYLSSKNSPLAEYSATILQQNNWKKIIALSNAESSLCKRYIVDKANCWGVGGSDLWDMGENLGEGVEAMNDFLNSSPRRSNIKYSQMNFQQMNGLYKQPPGDHWVYNNLEVYNDLTALERSVK